MGREIHVRDGRAEPAWEVRQVVTELLKVLALFRYGAEIINRLGRNIVIIFQMFCRSEKSRRWGASPVG